MKRILVITRSPWVKENSTGRTLADFFGEITDFEIYSLCFREAPNVCSFIRKNYYISEKQLIKGLFKRERIGNYTDNYCDIKSQRDEDNVYKISKKLNFMILNVIRELLWATNIWENAKFEKYLKEIEPDIVFFPDFTCVYPHRVLQYVHGITNAKVVIFHADDCYTLKQFSLSPLFWLYRLWLRKWVTKSVKTSTLHYVISDVQKMEYDYCFGVENKILTKFADFNGEPELKESYNDPLQLVYTGNVSLNRWKSLAVLVQALKKVNSQQIKAQLRIYTSNNITKRMYRSLVIPNSSFLMGYVSADEVERIQKDADVLIHVEAMNLKSRLRVRQSFSTKIVDYLKRGRAIFVVGPSEVASIKHLVENNCAIVTKNVDETVKELNRILEKKELLDEYAKKAYECGKKYHNRSEMLKMLHDDLVSISRKE